MNRKKAAAGFLAALLAVSLTACNKPVTPPASSAAATTEATAPSTTMATTESTTTTTETAAATTTKKKTTTRKPKPKATAPRKTAAPTKVTLPTNAPTGSPTPPPTSAPTENRFVLSAQGKAALARYQKGQEKFFALDSYHYTGHIQMEMNVDGHGFMMVTSSKEIYKHISARQLYATDSSSVAGEPSHQSVYIDGVTIYENIGQGVEKYDFDQKVFDSSYDFFSFSTLEENQILGYTTEGGADVFTLQLSKEDTQYFEESGQLRNLTATMKVSYTPEGYVSTEIDTFSADIGVVDETTNTTGWYTLRIVNKTIYDNPGQPVTVPRPDWVPADADNT